MSLVNAMIYYVRISPTFCEQYIYRIPGFVSFDIKFTRFGFENTC